MSVFSKLKMSRKAAKQHKEKEKEKEAEPVKVPYKHVPTHAAFDALSGAPSHWKYEDRSKIREQHKRRSQMAISRTGSSLSTMSYMNPAAGPSQGPHLPRNSSYNSYNPTWFDRGGDVNYRFERTESVPQRKKPSRGHSYHESGAGPSLRPSPLASNMHSEAVTPAVSSGNSTTSASSDNLEMASESRGVHVSCAMRPQPMVYEEKDILDRLHTSTTRKLGEAPQSDHPPPTPTVAAKTLVPPTTAAAVPPQKQKQKKNRWSLLGKKNASTTISAM